jgi:hypothetical protein
MRRIKAEQLTLALDQAEQERLMEQCARDVQFLINSGVNDYSLLLGVYELPALPSPSSGSIDATDGKRSQRYFHAQFSTDRQALYYLGLIDILSTWNWPRRIGYVLMPGVFWYYPRYTPPRNYGQRVMQSIKSLFAVSAQPAIMLDDKMPGRNANSN